MIHSGLPSPSMPSSGLPSPGISSSGVPSPVMPSPGFSSSAVPSHGMPSSGLPSPGMLSSSVPSPCMLSSSVPSHGMPSPDFSSSAVPSPGMLPSGVPSPDLPSPGMPPPALSPGFRSSTQSVSPSARSPDSSSFPSFPTILPPCRICNGKGSGLHYGVNTCEACKAFFRRCLTRQQSVKCGHKDFCEQMPGKRYPCPACRYKRCLAAGMSKDAIKTGRCTHERKTREIEEIKSLELQSRLRHDGSLMTTNERTKDMDRIINHLTNMHVSQTYQPNFHENVPILEKQFLQFRAMEEELYGSRKAVAREDYREIFNKTGLDIDGRRALIERIIPMIETSINAFISFAQETPGFRELTHRDQLLAVQSSCFQSWMFMFSKLYNMDNGVMVFPYDMSIVMSFDDMARFTDSQEIHDRILGLVKRIQDLDLTEEETVVCGALCLSLSDENISPDGRRILSNSSEFLIETLDYLLKKNHDPEDLTMSKVIQIISDCKELEPVFRATHHNMIEDAAGLQLPQIYLDLFTN